MKNWIIRSHFTLISPFFVILAIVIGALAHPFIANAADGQKAPDSNSPTLSVPLQLIANNQSIKTSPTGIAYVIAPEKVSIQPIGGLNGYVDPHLTIDGLEQASVSAVGNHFAVFRASTSGGEKVRGMLLFSIREHRYTKLQGTIHGYQCEHLSDGTYVATGNLVLQGGEVGATKFALPMLALKPLRQNSGALINKFLPLTGELNDSEVAYSGSYSEDSCEAQVAFSMSLPASAGECPISFLLVGSAAVGDDVVDIGQVITMDAQSPGNPAVITCSEAGPAVDCSCINNPPPPPPPPTCAWHEEYTKSQAFTVDGDSAPGHGPEAGTWEWYYLIDVGMPPVVDLKLGGSIEKNVGTPTALSLTSVLQQILQALLQGMPHPIPELSPLIMEQLVTQLQNLLQAIGLATKTKRIVANALAPDGSLGNESAGFSRHYFLLPETCQLTCQCLANSIMNVSLLMKGSASEETSFGMVGASVEMSTTSTGSGTTTGVAQGEVVYGKKELADGKTLGYSPRVYSGQASTFLAVKNINQPVNSCSIYQTMNAKSSLAFDLRNYYEKQYTLTFNATGGGSLDLKPIGLGGSGTTSGQVSVSTTLMVPLAEKGVIKSSIDTTNAKFELKDPVASCPDGVIEGHPAPIEWQP